MTRSRIAYNGLRCSRVTRPLRFRAVRGSVGARWTDGLYRMTRSPRSGQILQIGGFGPSMAPAGTGVGGQVRWVVSEQHTRLEGDDGGPEGIRP